MAQSDKAVKRPVQPALSELLAGYLRQQTSRQAAGLAAADSTSEVVPFDAVPVQPVDPELAWRGATAVASHFHPEAKAQTWPVPADWATLVGSQEPAAALAFSFGNYPQLVRDLHALLHTRELPALLPTGSNSAPLPSVRKWAAASVTEQRYPQALLAVGVLRLGRHFAEASELLSQLQASTPANWRAAWANEQAALAWHRGQIQEAATLWQKQPLSVPVLFNRGMAALFLGKAAEARPLLSKAVDKLSGEDGWHHLGRLYLTLAEIR